ncbi:YceI family protein [Pseudenhygromyxa sp. WMMC2535]|uniref:YceI family protein n=1 Tax=Pseudenhygromyxa sp. WMMC2535 TaxID=2712867 RepID=UPI0015557D7B|nr:YceI family protein [Pseudenhygromyxa sp. WMMC2535]NVB39718.1 YceI family protein [Pseudenhygromyxa sp. WMMC2535]
MFANRTQSFRHAFVLTMAFASVAACKSEIDEKPPAKTEPAAKVEDKDAAAEAGADKADADAGEAKTLSLAADTSKVGFIGAKVTADHKGSFSDVSGSLTMAGDKPESLEVTAKLASLSTDADKLTEHLKSGDFFDVETYPEAKFTSVSITEKAGEGGATHEIAGNLEMHGKTNKITFPATVTVGEGEVAGKAEFKINRKDWGIDYAGMADDLIKDEVAMELDLHFPRN